MKKEQDLLQEIYVLVRACYLLRQRVQRKFHAGMTDGKKTRKLCLQQNYSREQQQVLQIKKSPKR